jgi:hypothetical protein
MKPGPSKYEAGVLFTLPQRSVLLLKILVEMMDLASFGSGLSRVF